MAGQALKLVKKTLRHMEAMQSGNQVGGMLLAGDPGIGKTTFVKMLGKLLGLNTIIIEVPHITEEHLINIPFIVFSPTGGKSSGSTEVDQEYKLVLAQSSLFTQMTNAPIMPDQQYLEYMKKAPGHIQALFKELGGSEDTIPPAIAHIRASHKSILFLDEYYRQASIRIRNILRGILNGNLGMHKIPKDVYIMYASNMRDSGIDEIPSNHQFNMVEYKTPTKDDWFSYLISEYQDHADVKVNMTVMNKFKSILQDEHISYDDVASEVRTSPRRWEQLIMYINNAVPVANREEARALMSNVRNNFIHYQTGEYSDLAEKVTSAVAELISETSGGKVTSFASDGLEDHEWRSALNHSIEAQIKAGGTRKYVPIVSGPPGIGKTSQAASVALHHNLRLIELDVGEIYAEDAVGMAIPGDRQGENINVRFSVPKLHKQIMNIIQQKDAAYKEALKQEYGPTEGTQKYAEYEKQRWKYLIFFDELNRVDEKTFNALRKVILDKDFGPTGEKGGGNLELPKEAIVVGAINPEGVGTTELTSHFRDVIDIIPAKASWESTKKWLSSKKFNNVPEAVPAAALTLIDKFAEKFKSKNGHKPEQRPFYLDINGAEVYLSPREYNDMFATLVRELASVVDDFAGNGAEPDEIRAELNEMAADAFEDSLNMPFVKQGFEKDEFFETLKLWIQKMPDTVFADIITRVGGSGATSADDSLTSILKKYLNGADITKLPDDPTFVNANNVSNHAQFMEQVHELLTTGLLEEKQVVDHIIKKESPQITLVGDDLKYSAATKTCLLDNFVRAIVFALHIHEFAHDRVQQVGRTLTKSMSDLTKEWRKSGKLSEDELDEAMSTVIDIRSELHDLMEDL